MADPIEPALSPAAPYDDGYFSQEEPAMPYAFVQWKNTDACLDIHCECGESTHIDGFFIHSVRCAACGRLYALPMYATLHPITAESHPAEVERAKLTERDAEDERG